MKKLILALALVPSVAVAEFLPAGCYVAHYYRTDACWFSPTGVYEWAEPLANQNLYGSPVSTVMQRFFEEQSLKNSCLASLSVAETEYNSCAVDYNNLIDVKNTALSAYAKTNAYAKKLKKACGAKCKKIKAPKF